ncbi:enoyl-CoA hydratase/isomerase family protein [Halalkalibaculum sp. DA384]|uniref:enoyl-CoA hydratase/isomerase family protein n=1 Tax=Halalkalibaculum sp. DA384 TaxID=3373606 RepID=UPI003754BDD6
MSTQGSVTTDITNRIATITFQHPKGNALTRKTLEELEQAITSVGNDRDIRVVVIHSEGDGAFCGGAYFEELMKISTYEEGKRFFMGFARVINAMRKCPKLIIARVQGKAVGGGVGIAAAADHALAHPSAAVKLSELALGIGPFVVEPAICRKIGKSGFSTLAIDATHWYKAEWARKKGLYADILDSTDQLDHAVFELAEKLAKSNPEAIREFKKIFWSGTEHWDTLLEERAEISGRLVLSEYTRNYIDNAKNGNTGE